MRNRSRLFFVTLLIFLIAAEASSQSLYHTGLFFTSAPSPKEKRTSLDLTHDSPITVRNQFTVEFDLSIVNREIFGYVFRIFDKHHQNIDLVFIPKSGTLSLLKLAVNGQPTEINIALDEKELVRNHWLHISLTFDIRYGTVVCRLGDQQHVDNSLNISSLRKLFVCFGVNQSADFPTTDVPSMAVRNIKISDWSNSVRHNWLLNESEGNIATDLVGNLTAKVLNPEWIINTHFFWSKKDEFTLEESSGVTFDKQKNQLIFVGCDKVMYYNVVTSEKSQVRVENRKPYGMRSETYYYSPVSHKVYCIGSIPNHVNVYDEPSNRWLSVDEVTEPVQYINSSLFLDELTNAAYSIGGYGNYIYYNALLRYDFQTQSWTQIRLDGDNLIPRFYTSVTATGNPGEYYVFGGYGNSTGKQELGPQCLYDLYELDLNKSTIKKKWNIENVNENFVPMGSATVNESNSALFVLGFPPFLNDTYLKLYRISLESPGYNAVSDTIHFYFDEDKSKASLFFFEKTQEFYAVIKTPSVKDSATYKIFSLTYPPVNRAFMTSTFQTILTNPEIFPAGIYWIVAVLVIGMVYMLFFLLRKLHMANDDLDEEEKYHSFISNKIPTRNYLNGKRTVLPDKNAIYLFGDFRMLDSNGVDISKEFSTKLKQLFLSIFLIGGDKKGITNERLNAIHWTYHTSQSAKNNRNVNIKKLRDLLVSIPGVQLIHTEGTWMVKLGHEVFCDYSFMNKRCSGTFQAVTLEEFEMIDLILHQGAFLADEQSHWLESFKSQSISALINYLLMLADSFDKNNNFDLIIQVADAILRLDSLNDEAFRVKISAMIGKKNHHAAFVEYEYFTKEYEKMYGAIYPVSFKSMVG